MLMALSAMNRSAAKGSDGIRDHIVPVEMARDLTIGFRFGHFRVADEVPGACRNKSESFNAIARPWPQDISCDLLFHKLSVRLVFIECTNHIIAIGPSIRPLFVFVVPVRIAVVHHVEPMPRPSLAIPLRSKQLLDELVERRLGIDT